MILFNDPITQFFCMVIALLFLVGSVYCTVRGTRILRGISEALEALGGGTLSSFDDWQKFAAKVAANPILGKAFRLYAKQVRIRAGSSEEGAQHLVSYASPCEFFHEESLFNAQLNAGLTKSLPGLLTGFGILGTFFGLIFGLNASEALSSTSVTEVSSIMASVQELLSSAGIAFVTSVAGLLTSIIFTLAFHLLHFRVLDRIREFNRCLEEAVPVAEFGDFQANTEARDAMLIELMKRVEANTANQAKEQSVILCRIVEDVLSTFSTRVTEQMSNVAAAYAESAEAIAASASALKGTVGEIEQRIAAASETASLNLSEMTQKTDTQCEKIAEAGASLTRNLTELSENVNAALSGLDPLLKRNAETVGNLAGVGSTVAETGKAFAESVKVVTDMGDEVKAAAKSLSESVGNSVAAMQASQDKTNERFETWLAGTELHFKELTEKINDLTRQNTALQQIVGESMNAFDEGMQRINQQMQGNFKEIDTGLAKAVGLLTGTVENWYAMQESNNQTVQGRLKEAAAALKASADGRKETDAVLTNSVKLLQSSMQSWQSGLEKASKNMAEKSSVLESKLGQFEQRVSAADRKLGDRMKQMKEWNESVSAMQIKLSQDISDNHKELSESRMQLKSEIEAARSEISSSHEKISGIVNLIDAETKRMQEIRKSDAEHKFGFRR